MSINLSGNTISSGDVSAIVTSSFITRINKSGLVLHLDAADKNSYIGSGTWNDLSGNGYTGTLYGNTYWDSTNGGRFVFDGSGDYIDTNSSTILPNGTMEFTIEAFYTLTSSATNGEIFGNYGTSYTTDTVWFSGVYGLYLNSSVYATSTPISNAAHHLAAVRRYDGQVTLYLDGSLNNTGRLTAPIATNQNYRIGADVNGAGEAFTGSLYVLRVYTRELQPYEIAENYRAQKDRFGL